MDNLDNFGFATKMENETLRELQTSCDQGLSKQEVLERQKKYGLNEVVAEETSWWQVLWRQFRSPFLFLLLFAACLAFILGEKIDGTLIIIFVLINAFLGFYQEYHSEQAVQLLKQYITKKVKVLRNGEELLEESTTLVPGDIVLFSPGDLVTADVRLIGESNLLVDESVLTGESEPVKKDSHVLSKIPSQAFEAINMLFSGTTIVSGKGVGVVVSTGRETALGKIGKITAETVRVSSFEKNIFKLSQFILRLVLVTLVFLMLGNILIKGEQSNPAELVIFAIALAVSVIPEALPVVITFSLSRGALRLAKNKVVVKRLSAIEDLGAIEVLCTDKTGTLTENRMTVASLKEQDNSQLLFFAGLAASLLAEGKKITSTFDLAIQEKISEQDKAVFKKYERINELPFDPQRRKDSIVVNHKGEKILIVRGAPELILASSLVSSRERVDYQEWFVEEGKKGRRVLAVAKKVVTPTEKKIENCEAKDLQLLGMISFVDPLKKTAPEAIKKATELGIQIKILTGDTKEVAGIIAAKIGLIKAMEDVITGEEFDKLSDPGRHRAVEKYAVFARVSPQQKYEIIRLLEEKHEVGYLGEGINDAPALKIANVALVVSDAVDVARGAADIILLKRSLKVIIDGVQEGREVFANTTKYIKATLACNFGNFFAIAFVSLFITFLPMLPVQILLLNLLSDFPMVAIATDNVDPEELKQPRTYNIREIALLATVLGVVSSAFDFIMFGVLYKISATILQTGWFTGSVLTELVFLFSIRTKLPIFKAKTASLILWLLTGLAAVITLALPFTRFGQEVFHFVRLSNFQLAAIGTVTLVYFFVTEAVKQMYHRWFDHSNYSLDNGKKQISSR